LETNLTHDQKERLQMVKKSGDSLLELLNDLLDFSKIEAGKFTLVNSPFALSALLTDLVNIFRLRAKEKGLELKLSISPEIPRRLQGDALRLRQILMNLLSNAIKFTERGSVHLEVTQQTKTANEVVLLFSVADTGIGIEPSKQELIFEAFQQIDDSSTRHFGGTGLGLAISRELVKLMQGQLWTVSAPGHGSTFYFTVALFPICSSEKIVHASSRLADVTIPECDPDTLREVLAIFKESVEKQLTQLAESLTKKEDEMIIPILLKLKGILSNFGKNNAYHAAEDLEKILKTNRQDEHLEAYELLKREVESLGIYLEGKMHENLTC
jgi:HPt (histidine-containing phosphotransfer) domain-containing protein